METSGKSLEISGKSWASRQLIPTFAWELPGFRVLPQDSGQSDRTGDREALLPELLVGFRSKGKNSHMFHSSLGAGL